MKKKLVAIVLCAVYAAAWLGVLYKKFHLTRKEKELDEREEELLEAEEELFDPRDLDDPFPVSFYVTNNPLDGVNATKESEPEMKKDTKKMKEA